jgi:hypothetical protein
LKSTLLFNRKAGNGSLAPRHRGKCSTRCALVGRALERAASTQVRADRLGAREHYAIRAYMIATELRADSGRALDIALTTIIHFAPRFTLASRVAEPVFSALFVDGANVAGCQRLYAVVAVAEEV